MGDSVRSGVIEKTELLSLVNGSTGFTVVKFPLNPGLVGTLPVGYTEAKNWTEWKCKYFKVEFIPTVSEYATQGQQGEVALAVDYNAVNAVPTTMQQIEAMHFAGGGIPSRGFKFNASVKHMNKADPKNVRTGAVPAGDDLRKYDGGNLYFAVNGCTNATQVGKLEIKYRFEMELPTLLNVLPANDPDIAFFQSPGVGEAGAATGVAKIVPLATASFNGLGAVNTAGSIVPPAGNYVVSADCTFIYSGSATFASLTIQKNGVAVPLTPSTFAFTAASLTSLELNSFCIVTCNGTDALTLVATGTYSTGSLTLAGSVILELA
jgi:hypothetical protein